MKKFIKNATAIQCYFISIISFAIANFVRQSAPILYIITLIIGLIALILGFKKRQK